MSNFFENLNDQKKERILNAALAEFAQKKYDDASTNNIVTTVKKNDVFKKVKGLSMGEKCRVAFARLILSGANFFVLDEPTNHLDIAAKEKIEKVLEQYTGGILFVSHDIYFVQRIAAKIMLLEHGSLKFYDGNYDYYLRMRKNECVQNTGELDFITIHNRILQLECDLAFIGGKLNQRLGEDDKKSLNEE